MKPVVPFWVAILATVTGLLIMTGGFLIFYDLHWGQRSIELLKAYYLDQVADTAEKEVARLARIGVQALLAQRYRFETGSYTTDDSIALARTLAAVLPADPDIDAITFREGATGRVMSATRVDGKEFVLTVSDPRIDGGIPKQFRADTLAPLLHAALPAGSLGRDGYRRAVGEPETIVWIPHDTSAGLALGITAALAVRDPSGRVIGVVTVNFARSGIAGFLRSIKIGEHGSVVLFGSNDESLAGAPGQGREAAALAVARWTRETGSPIVDEKARRTEILIDGAKWNIVARSIPREAGPPWIVAAALPDSDFPSPLPDLAPLATPIEARVRLILGKRIHRQSYPAQVYRLGPNGAEFESPAPLEVFSALQLSLPGRTSNECAETVDAKVMAAEEGANARRTVVRFTGVDWSTAAGIET